MQNLHRLILGKTINNKSKIIYFIILIKGEKL